MRLIPDTLIGRTILILILGTLIIASDLALIYTLLLSGEQTIFDWVVVFGAVLLCLVIIGYVISRQLIAPLKQLSLGARRFSTEMHTTPIPETGPEEVREAAQNFNQMQEHIQRFVEERMQLVAAISHDLRTPLTRLRLRVESLPDELQKQKALSDIDDMKAMIQSTLSFIHEDSAKETAVKTNVATLIHSICDDTSDMFGPAQYVGPGRCVLVCKPIAIKRAISNLVENAVKYGKQAKVELYLEHKQIKIKISDQGPGIPEQELKNVFIPFYRLEKSRNRETGGVGLGLSVAQTLIQTHCGNIQLKNISPTGLCVEVVLPI